MMTEPKPLIVGVNVTENTMREPNPHVPWTPREIAAVAAECERAGASVMHFHARTATGKADHSADTYAQIVRDVRATSSLILVPSMANVPGHGVEERLANIAPNQLDPATSVELLPIDVGSANMDLFDPTRAEFATEDRIFINETGAVGELMRRAQHLGLHPYLASFNLSWTRAIIAHHAAGRLETPLVIAFVLGGEEFVAAHPTSAHGVQAHLDTLPSGLAAEWFVSSYRGNVLEVAEYVIAAGGHVMIGTGDFHHDQLGLPTSADLVDRVVSIGRSLGREPATPDEARKMLGVKLHAGR